MPAIRLATFDASMFQQPIDAQVRTLADTVMRFKRELEYLLNGNLDAENGVNSTAGSLDDVWTAIHQTETDIDLIAGDVAGNTAAINVNAQAITLKVSSSDYNGNTIVSKINLTGTTATILASRIDLIGATTFRSGSGSDYITINQNVLMFNEEATGNAKMALGFVPDRNGVNIPGIVFGAGDGQGNNRGYITKDTDSLDMFHISSTGVASYISLGNGKIWLNGKEIPVADQNGKLVDGYINSAATWNAKLDEATMKTNLQNPSYDITIPKENIGVLGSENIDYASITTAVIQNLSVGTAQIQDLAVTNAKIGSLAVDSGKIGDLAVTTAKIDNLAVTNGKIANLAVDRAKIQNAAIGSAQIDSAVITYAHIANATIKTANIETAAITTALIATEAVDTAQIKNGSITDAKIVELTANKITAGTLSVERLIIRDAVTPANSIIYQINNISGALQALSGDTLNGEILTPRTITADRIVAGAITANEIAAGTITANKLVAGTITAASGIIGSIDASKITTGTLSANRISGGTISGVSINIGDDCIVGDNLWVGGINCVGLRRSGSTYWLQAGSTTVMQFYTNALWLGGGSCPIDVKGTLECQSTVEMLSTLTAAGKMYANGGISLGAALDCNSYGISEIGALNGVTSMAGTNTSISVTNAFTLSGTSGGTIQATQSGSTLSISAGSTVNITGGSYVNITGTNYGVKISGYIGFFGTTPIAKRTVGDPNATTVTAAGSTWSSTWGGQVKTDIEALRAKLLSLIDALQAYGLIA